MVEVSGVGSRRERAAKEGLVNMSDLDDILNQDHIKADIDEFAEVISSHFGDLEAVIILWRQDGDIHHRAYGTVGDLVGLMEQAKFIMLRENTGDTREPA